MRYSWCLILKIPSSCLKAEMQKQNYENKAHNLKTDDLHCPTTGPSYILTQLHTICHLPFHWATDNCSSSNCMRVNAKG